MVMACKTESPSKAEETKLLTEAFSRFQEDRFVLLPIPEAMYLRNNILMSGVHPVYDVMLDLSNNAVQLAVAKKELLPFILGGNVITASQMGLVCSFSIPVFPEGCELLGSIEPSFIVVPSGYDALMLFLAKKPLVEALQRTVTFSKETKHRIISTLRGIIDKKEAVDAALSGNKWLSHLIRYDDAAEASGY
jgi:hypothetical protein